MDKFIVVLLSIFIVGAGIAILVYLVTDFLLGRRGKKVTSEKSCLDWGYIGEGTQNVTPPPGFRRCKFPPKEGENMKVYEVIVINKEKNEVICKEIVLAKNERMACALTSLSAYDKLKGLVFGTLEYVIDEKGSY